LRLGEGGSGHGATDEVRIRIVVEVEEDVASGRQRIRRVIRESLCLVETVDEDVRTHHSHGVVNGGRADGPGASGVVYK
jgi:hypothetical protein